MLTRLNSESHVRRPAALSAARVTQSGFTLIEVLVVVVIITVLLTLLLPALGEAKRRARVLLCATNLNTYATGLIHYAVSNRDFPAHSLGPQITARSLWGEAYGFSFFTETYGNKVDFLTMFRDEICGGSMRILWCPLHTYFYNPMRPDLYIGATDPQFPLLWYEAGTPGGSGYNNYYSGYWRFANLAGVPDWSYSGNSQTQGPPRRPGSDRDAILADPVYSQGGPITESTYGGPHLDWMWVTSDEGVKQRRENNVAYSDGHVETHGSSNPYVDDENYLMWEGANYVPRGNGERWTY